MIGAELVRSGLCEAFCSSVAVSEVPAGLAVGTAFCDDSGDPLDFYVVKSGAGLRIKDDGGYLAHLIGSGMDVDGGPCGQALDAILAEGGATWSRDTLEIRSEGFEAPELGERAVRFISALIRVRDLKFITARTRPRRRLPFRDVATSELTRRYAAVASFSRNEPVDDRLSEFPADLVIRPKRREGAMVGAVYFATSTAKLDEALLLQIETARLRRGDVWPVALEDRSGTRRLPASKVERARNRDLAVVSYCRGEADAVERIGEALGLAA